ncbi:MAG: aspartate-semialdehyde dehydrogenase [Actinomycetota bacterium]|nr:aspartate-semialdehyde dehydrogenase [Actinomycetota bacterium]
MRVVVVGATGAVGTEMLKILAERGLDAHDVVAVASQRSAGRKLEFAGRTLEVQVLGPDVFTDGDLALFDVPDEVSREWAPIAAAAGAVVVDNSAAWRMDPDVPLVVPEVNAADAQVRPKGIIASPNCTALAIAVPLGALNERVPLTRVICASYQAASGAGKAGVDDLWDQTLRIVKDPETAREGLGRDVLEPGNAFAHPLAMNVIPQIGSVKDNGFTSEEIKVGEEIRKILGAPDLPLTATCVRVPVVTGHAVAVHAEFARPIDPDTARAILAETPGVEVVDDPGNARYPTPLEAAGRDPAYVGRIRQDPHDERALELFCAADNLRKGAALNTVQIAELLVR